MATSFIRSSKLSADLLGGQALLFLGIQFALVPAALAFPWIVRGRGRTLVLVGTALYVISAFGHAAFSGAQLMLREMIASDDLGAMREVFVAFDTSSTFVAIAVPGLVGLVFGSLILGIGIIRSTELRWWIGASLIAFLVSEFALSNLGEWGTLLAAAFWAVAYWGTAVFAWRSRSGAVVDTAA